jgi:hypothetical protein
MADILNSGRLKIVSVAHEHVPLGVNHTMPAWQIVSVGAPVQDWELRPAGPGRFHLSIGGYGFTGVLDRKVIASTHPEHAAEWVITHQEHRNAYTIALANKPHLGWTVPINLKEGHQVALGPILSTPSIPPQFLPTQLFSIRRHLDE